MRSRTGEPKSAEAKNMVGSDAIAPWICSNNASRIALGLTGIVSFQQRIEQFRLRRKDVSQGLVFEARDTAPLQSSGDEGLRLTVGDRLEAQELALELQHVVTIDLDALTAERLQTPDQTVMRYDIVGESEHADAVVVDNEVQVVQFVLGCEHDGLPIRALMQFAITRDDEDALFLSVSLETQSNA